MAATDPHEHEFCNVLARAKGLDPVGNARVFDIAVAVEMPLPWTRDILHDAEQVPAELVQLVDGDPTLPKHARPRVRPIFMVPDIAYSAAGYRRVIIYTRPQGAFATFDRAEYMVPYGEAGSLIAMLHQHPDTRSDFDQYRVDTANVRDIMICTHGTRDAACGKFGYPLYESLRATAASATVRIWRVNHLGGHVFGPTLVDMPKGDYWGYLDEPTATLLIERKGDIHVLAKRYRGWAGLPEGFLQVAERDILMREGWAWQAVLKRGVELARDTSEEPQWADIRIDYQTAEGSVQGAYEARVAIENHIMTIASTGKTILTDYPQYRVHNLKTVPS